MRALVTGVNGQLGHDAALELAARGWTVAGSDVAAACGLDVHYIRLDITGETGVREAIGAFAPDVVVHCAAWTDVDGAESNAEAAFAVNERGSANLARACERAGCRMLYVSTDYVFDGSGSEPWKPDCADFGPLNVYGASKLAGERAVSGALEKHYIVRTQWVFGKNGRNFVRSIKNAAKRGAELRVVCDQFGAPTYAADLARFMAELVETEHYGYHHATNSGGYISWYDFAREITDAEIAPAATGEYAAAAKRPKNGRLDTHKIHECGLSPLPDWRDALSRYMKER